jgi:hypothetical protein
MTAHRKELTRIVRQLDELADLVERAPTALDLRVEKVSLWSVRQQVDHTLKVLALGLRAFDGQLPPLSRGINLLGRALLAVGWLPRGRGRSPKSVLPTETSTETLAAEIRRLRAVYSEPALAEHPIFGDPTPIVPHPYFGGLTAAQGIRMLAAHTWHHQKIVRDIRRAAA